MGGLFALGAALVVAFSIRRRDEVASGMLVSCDLLAVRVASEALINLSDKDEIGEEEYPLWFSEKLVYSHPSLSRLFEASVVRIMPVDVTLAAHLGLFHRIYSEIQIMLNRLSEDYDHYHRHGKTVRSKEHMRADCRLIARHFERVVKHAECAENLISKLILSKLSVWHRLRRRIRMNKQERECLKLLRTG